MKRSLLPQLTLSRFALPLATLLLTSLVLIAPAYAQVCSGNVTLGTQAEVDTFSCDSVTGNLSITGADITNLAGLSGLTSVGGELRIQNNAALTSIGAFGALGSVGRLLLIDNDALTSVAAFGALESAGELRIQNNAALTSIGAFGALTSVGSLLLIDNAALTSIGAFSALTSVGGRLVIQNNAALTSVAPFDALESVGGELRIQDNDALTSLTGLSELTSVGSGLYIWRNAVLANLTGLENLTSVGGELIINRNAALTTLAGIENLTFVGGSFFLNFNAVLTDGACALTGLVSIEPPAWTGVTVDVEVRDNGGAPFTSVEDLLTAVVLCSASDALETTIAAVAAVAGLNRGLTRSLTVKAAQARARYEDGQIAAALGVLAALAQQVDALVAGGQLTASQRDVLVDAIDTLVIAIENPQSASAKATSADGLEAASTDGLLAAFALAPAYPNPFSTSATITFDVAEAVEGYVVVYDVLGREVALLADGELERGRHEIVLDAVGLPSGTYLVRMSTATGFTQTRRITLVR